MRIAVLTGVLACALIFGLGSEKTSALPLDKLDNINETTSVDTLLSVAVPKQIEEIKVDIKIEEPEQKKHIIEENESLSDIAKKYDVSWRKIFDRNTELANPDIINPGDELLIPTAEEAVPARELPVIISSVRPVVQPQSTNNQARTTAAAQPAVQAVRGNSSGNRYVAGYCTWHVKNLRPDLPNNLGNARTWVARAAAQGIPTGSTPRVGAAAQRGNHIAYVTAVNSDGTINISDMNYRSLYQITNRTVPANQWSYIY